MLMVVGAISLYSGTGFLQTNENMEVTSALQSEQHVKKELAKKLGQLQENLGELKETVSNSSRTAGQVCSSLCKEELAIYQTLMERWKLVL